MRLEMRRVILFTANIDTMSKFYRDIIGLELVNSEDGWREFSAGPCTIALHRGASSIGSRPPKLVFYASDVAAARTELVKRGAVGLGKLLSTDNFDMCNGKDPDGNPFQISSRKLQQVDAKKGQGSAP
jgi:catechol 2,3-dioxygenase-like lactoylglutathione lyase family enzyme